MSNLVAELLKKYDIISEQIELRELRVILRECERSLGQAETGASFVEFGCYEGTTSLFMQRLIQSLNPAISFHVYDSFGGLPPKTSFDASTVGEQFVTGELKTSKQVFIQNFRRAHVPLPIIHKGWFRDLTPPDVPDKIVFAFLDGDYYESITDSLKLVWPKLLPQAIIVVDDYQNEALPGTQRAVDQWLTLHPAHMRIEASLAIIRPQ